MKKTFRNKIKSRVNGDIHDFIDRQQILGQAQLEEFCPTDADHQEHLSRYIFVEQYLKARCRVLDIACGIGYGSRHLADSAKGIDAFGIDLSEQAVKYAVAHFRNDNISFIVGDGTRLPFPDNAFDFVISFETVEHIPEYQAFLSDLCRVLRPGGTLILSTPNREFTNPLGNLESRPPSSHHFREWRMLEFQPLLSRFFENINWFSQLPVKRPLAEKLFIIFRRPLARVVPVLRTMWEWWHRQKARGAGSTEDGLMALRERFKISPWNDGHPGRTIVAVAEKGKNKTTYREVYDSFATSCRKF